MALLENQSSQIQSLNARLCDNEAKKMDENENFPTTFNKISYFSSLQSYNFDLKKSNKFEL